MTARLEIKHVVEKLRFGTKVSDADFDSIFPEQIQSLSRNHWTPVSVALRAAKLLVRDQGTRVLDVGSGTGKFCLIGAAVTEGVFTGIEQRASLVDLSNSLALAADLSNVQFLADNMTDHDWSVYDAFYFYNPFYENVTSGSLQIDFSIKASRSKFNRYVHYVTQKLKELPPGVRVATYHGFGGEFPSGFARERREAFGSGSLELWVKSAN